MEYLKDQVTKKQSLILVFFAVILVLSISAVSTTTSYLYRSRADENPDTIRVEQDSVAISPIDTRAHSCIKSLTYLPNENGDGCFAQFECENEVEGEIPSTCTSKLETISCNELSSCLSRMEWINMARKVCGC